MDSNQRTRRRVIGSLGATGVVGLAGCLGGDDGDGDGTGNGNGGGNGNGNGNGNGGGDGDSTGETGGGDGNLSIGVLEDLTGPLTGYGLQSLRGFLAGLAYKNDRDDPLDIEDEGDYEYAVGDTDIELLVRSTEFDPATAQNTATRLVQDEDVDVLFGVGNSGGARRVINTVVQRTDTPFVASPAADADITNDVANCHELVFRANETAAMDARSGGRYIAEETDVETMALFGADYSFGRNVVDSYRAVLEANDIEIVMSRFVPQEHAEWEGLLQQAEDQGADGMVGGFTFLTLGNLVRSFLEGDYDYNMYGGFATVLATSIMGDVVQSQLGEDFTQEQLDERGLGPFTTRYHWNQYDNEINDWFEQAFLDTYGVVPDLFTSGAFAAASSIVQSVEEGGSTDGTDVAAGMRGMTIQDTPKGEGGYTYQEYNNQARSEMTIAPVVPTETEGWEAAVQPGEPIVRMSGDEVTVPEDDPAMTCELGDL